MDVSHCSEYVVVAVHQLLLFLLFVLLLIGQNSRWRIEQFVIVRGGKGADSDCGNTT